MSGRNVFVDAEVVDLQTAQQARHLAQGDGIVSTYHGTDWPEEDDQPVERVASHRSLEMLDRCHDWLDSRLSRVRQRVDRNGGDLSLLDLSESVRHPLLYDFVPWFSRAIALDSLERSRETDWIWRPRSPREQRLGRRFLTAFDRVRPAWVPPPASRLTDAAKWGRKVAFACRESLRDRQSVGGGRPGRVGKAIRVVFAEYFPNSARWSMAVARELSAAASVEIGWAVGRRVVADELLGQGAAAESLRLVRFPHLGALLRTTPRASLRRWARLAGRHEPRGSEPEGEACGLLFEELVLPRLVEAQLWLSAVSPALAAMQPDIVVSTTYSSPFGAAVVQGCRRLGVPSVYLQHGVLPARRCYSQVPSDFALVWSEYEAAALRGSPRATTRVRATGPVLYDELKRRMADQPAGADRGRPCVAFMASRTGGSVSSVAASRRTLRLVREACRRTGHDLVVKIHPGDTTGILEAELAGDREVVVEQLRSSQEVIEESDLVVVVSSTTAFEAVIAGKPLLLLNLTGTEDYTGVAAAGAAIYVDDERALAEAIAQALGDADTRSRLEAGRRRLIAERLAGTEPRATANAAREILVAVRGTES